MLYLEIQNDKKEMKTSEFQQYIGGTAACTKKLTRGTKGCVQIFSNYTYFYDSYLSGVKTADEASAEGVDYCVP